MAPSAPSDRGNGAAWGTSRSSCLPRPDARRAPTMYAARAPDRLLRTLMTVYTEFTPVTRRDGQQARFIASADTRALHWIPTGHAPTTAHQPRSICCCGSSRPPGRRRTATTGTGRSRSRAPCVTAQLWGRSRGSRRPPGTHRPRGRRSGPRRRVMHPRTRGRPRWAQARPPPGDAILGRRRWWQGGAWRRCGVRGRSALQRGTSKLRRCTLGGAPRGGTGAGIDSTCAVRARSSLMALRSPRACPPRGARSKWQPGRQVRHLPAPTTTGNRARHGARGRGLGRGQRAP